MLGTSIICKEALLCRGEGLGLHGPGGDPPRDDGRVQLVQGQLEADGPPVAHRGHIPPLWMRVTVECFHALGILVFTLQAL